MRSAFEKPWSAADGVRNWGDWFFNSIGLADREIITPHLYSTSVLNFGIIVGAFLVGLSLGDRGEFRVPDDPFAMMFEHAEAIRP